MFEKRTGEVLTDIMIDWGIDHIYGLPGDSINELMDDLRKKKEEIQFIQVRHEETAALAAASYGKLTGKLGVCLSIAGPGAVHLLNGLYDAKEDGAPVLALVGQVTSDEVGTDSFQELHLERLFSDVAVFSKRVQSEHQLPDLLNQAIRSAYTENGVSVLIIPDDLSAQAYKTKEPLTSSVKVEQDVFPSIQQLEKAHGLIKKAKKPIILAGRGTKHARDELLSFAEKIGSPIIVSLLGKGVIPDEHPYCLGHLGQIGTRPAYHAMKDTDLLIMIGTSFPYRKFLPKEVEAIQIDVDPRKIGKRYPITQGLVGDSKAVLSWLSAKNDYTPDTAYLEKAQEQMASWRKDLVEEKEDKTERLRGAQVMRELQKVLADDAILSVDVGNVTVWTSRYLNLTNQKMIVSGYLATMGCGLPGAIAGKIAYPDKQVVAVCGDGGFTMVMHDFVTAVKYNLPIMVVILNNSKIGMIQYEQQEIGHLNYETDLADIDFAQFAQACGGEGYRVQNPDELESAMKKAALSKKPVILDVMIELQPPLPGKITYDQAVHYTEYLIQEFFEKGHVDMPPFKKALKRLF
ncbi:pyruvate oxidase [Falsibacillus pallidus]|uniref:Pyruvate oxidase n=1 Tax=Falsibacillus pallidus TaxID=493781 RepID=A0A370GM02_9BACI|nr:pyruvate oxidase [Falsibacillus pallidus]RDI44296.1 pyruvate oxidase [Falsibacillus pallidus]